MKPYGLFLCLKSTLMLPNDNQGNHHNNNDYGYHNDCCQNTTFTIIMDFKRIHIQSQRIISIVSVCMVVITVDMIAHEDHLKLP